MTSDDRHSHHVGRRSGVLAAVVLVLAVGAAPALHAYRVEICDFPGEDAFCPRVAFGGGQHLVVWRDTRDGGSVYGRLVTPPRQAEPPEDGFVVCAGIGTGMHQDVAYDGARFLVVWATDGTGASDIRGAFVENGTPTSPFDIAAGPPDQTIPRVEFAGSVYLVVWHDNRHHPAGSDVYCARVTPGGTVLDPAGIRVSDVPYQISDVHSIASDGSGFLVGWTSSHGPLPNFPRWPFVATVSEEGSAGDTVRVADGLIRTWGNELASGDGKYLAVMSWCYAPEDILRVYARSYDPAAGMLGPLFLFAGESEVPDHLGTSACFGTATFISTYLSWRGPGDVVARRTSLGGVLGGELLVQDPLAIGAYSIDIAWDGSRALAVWHEELSAHHGVVYADTVSQWQDHFWSQSPLATAYNQGRSVAKDPETGIVHMTYMSGDSVFYSYSPDNGAHYVPYEFVALGTYPCVTCVPEGAGVPGRVWISYLTSDQPQIVCKARLGPGQWRTYVARRAADDAASWLGPPSTSPGYQIAAPIPLRGVYLAYAVSYAGAGSSIEYRAVDFDLGIVGQFVVDDVSYVTRRDPSIATTPGDVISVVWQRDDGIEQHTMYRNCYYGSWGNTVTVSFHPVRPYAEPSWEPSAEAYGDSAYVVWRGRSEVGTPDGDIWQRTVPIEPFPWPPYEPRDLSLTTGVVSEFPQNSLNAAVAYQEEWATWDLFGYIVGQNRTLVSDAAESRYVDITAEWQPDPAGLGLDAIWTSEEPAGQYEVKFLHRDYGPEDAPARNWYYDCGIGDTGKTRYCLLRDGRAKWRDFQVDYGRQQLCYRLPFLNPSYIYKLRAVLFHASRDTWVNDFSFEGRRATRVAFRPLQPETVWVTIPRDLYANDCEATLDISRIAGEYAALAGLRLYQYSPYRQGNDEGVQSGSAAVSARSRCEVVGASLSRGGIALSYQVDASERASLRIYDARGAVVRELVSGPAVPGRHEVRWDGTDATGRRVPTGTYFCRLERGKTSQVCKVVLTR